MRSRDHLIQSILKAYRRRLISILFQGRKGEGTDGPLKGILMARRIQGDIRVQVSHRLRKKLLEEG